MWKCNVASWITPPRTRVSISHRPISRDFIFKILIKYTLGQCESGNERLKAYQDNGRVITKG